MFIEIGTVYQFNAYTNPLGVLLPFISGLS